MKSWFKFENVQAFFSKMFGRTKHKPPMAQFAGHRERDLMKNTPLNIIVVSEVSEATDRDTSTTGMGNARSDALNYSTISTMVIDSPRHNVAHTIVGSEHEACQVDTITMGGFLNNPHHFVMRDSMLVDNSTNIIHHKVDHKAEKVKKQLSKHMIRGAAHDSSARDPPPKCHPGTRIKIHERIMAWFYDEIKHELLLWIYGPAGVGKSAIVQTLAEVLASAGCLGASVFFSRPSARNYSHSVFITVAYQLAVHIEPYCSFICELLAFDPEVVNKSMEEQFRAFIVEPFVQKNIGKGGKPLGILLDGLDELDHQHQQQKIIHLITGFVQNHPEVPLVWVISSRPEPHITNTFKQQRLICYYKEEYVPIDSPEACQDVERYLRNSFETIQKVNFPHIVHTGWPEEKKMVKLAHAALGLFAFADVAIRFVGDPNHVDPVTRLNDVLSVIDGSRVGSADDQPFAHLDALYTCILSRIPSKMWPITQRVLAAVPEVAHLSYNLRCVKGLSVILGLELSKVYASINDLYSLLDVPPLGDVYSRKLHFHHASFLDFLRDATRSKKFYTSSWTAKRDFRESGVRIWQDFKRQSSAGPNCGDEWSTYTSQFHSGANHSAAMLGEFNNALFFHIHRSLWKSLRKQWNAVQKEASQPCEIHQFLDLLCQMDAATACCGIQVDSYTLVKFWLEIWKKHRVELTSRGIVSEIQLKQLSLDRLEWPAIHPTDNICILSSRKKLGHHDDQSPRKVCLTNEYVSGLKYFHQYYPDLQVLICGVLGNRFAIFRHKFTDDDFKESPFQVIQDYKFVKRRRIYGYYCIPYKDNV